MSSIYTVFTATKIQNVIEFDKSQTQFNISGQQLNIYTSTLVGPIGYVGSQGFVGSYGFTGSTGFTGSQGPAMGPVGYTGSAGFQGSSGAGPQGPTGYRGSAGQRGSVGGGTDLWVLVTSTNITAGSSNVVVNNLGTYTELLVQMIAVTGSSGSGSRGLRVSTNNGATFLTSGYSYIIVGNGALISENDMGIGTPSVSERYGTWHFVDPSTTNNPKLCYTTNDDTWFISTSTAINAVQLRTSIGTLQGGTFNVYGKT